MNISIVTATYNRKESLARLHDSILSQNYNAVEWIIVDDGGTDGTEIAVAELQKTSPIIIKYAVQQNAGKNHAVNRGLDMVTGDAVAIVDDDDYFLPGMFHTVAEDYDKIRDRPEMVGLWYLTVDPAGKVWGNSFPQSGMISDHYECRINQKVFGDKIEFTRASAVHEHNIRYFCGADRQLYPVDTLFFLDVAKQGKTMYLNRNLLVKDYQPDGLSVHWRQKSLAIPWVTQHYYVAHLVPQVRFAVRLRYMVAAIGLALYSGEKRVADLIPMQGNRLVYALAYIPGFIVARSWIRARKKGFPLTTKWLKRSK